VLDYSLIVGNPSRQIGWVSKAGHKLEFNSDNLATCPETNESYQLQNGVIRTT
jgi:UDP-2-acetamido-3-amino-2,3-dideoxy-glucuronate N-acetyltransferase